MNAFVQALATSGGLMLAVLVVVTLASMAAHKRGETAGHHDAAADNATEGAASGLGFALGPERDPLVLEILGLGLLLFVIAMGLLLGISMMGQM